MKRILLSTLLFLNTIGAVFADEVSFIGSAPKSVVVGNRFNISYEANTKTDSQPTLPDVEGLRILMGPSSSTFTSMQNINGRVTSKQTITFTYVVVADKEGDITIPGASVMVEGKKITSNAITVKVLPEDKASSASQQGGSGNASVRQQGNRQSTEISKDDLFIVASVNKTKVYDREAILLTYKVYTAVNLVNLDNPTPELQGFNIQEVELSQNRQFELEHYKGRNYNTLVWRQYVLFPQQTGKLEIPSMDYEAVVAVQTRNSMDPFEMMFNGGYSYMEVKKNLRSNKVVIDVQELPKGKPDGFSGGVGNFNVSSTVSTTKLKSNEEFTLKVTVKGYGNMKLMGDPVVDFPSEFDVYDPIIKNDYRLANNGFKGEKTYEYVITPRTSGSFVIPPARFVYFDTATGNYKTVESTAYTIEVEKGASQASQAGNIYIAKEDGKILANDIRHIKLGGWGSAEKGDFFGTTIYCLLYVISISAFAIVVFVYRRRIKENANVSLMKTKKANSVAVRRLKNAKALMQGGRVNEFYDEILKAVWGYMSDKLNIPLSQLSKENMASELMKRGCDDAVIAGLTRVLDEGEFARYAPGDTGAKMDEVYRMTLSAISKLENSIKR